MPDPIKDRCWGSEGQGNIDPIRRVSKAGICHGNCPGESGIMNYIILMTVSVANCVVLFITELPIAATRIEPVVLISGGGLERRPGRLYSLVGRQLSITFDRESKT